MNGTEFTLLLLDYNSTSWSDIGFILLRIVIDLSITSYSYCTSSVPKYKGFY